MNKEFALNFVGLGLIVQNAENVQNGAKDIFGKLSYIGSTVKTLMDPSNFDFTLTIDGEKQLAILQCCLLRMVLILEVVVFRSQIYHHKMVN